MVEKSTILVWLDFDCYSYINFGIVNALAAQGQHDFIGVVAAKADYEFFSRQKLVPFKELLHYPDCYNNKAAYDSAHLDSLVRKYCLDIWNMAYSERSFYKYWTDFHRFTRDEILSIMYYTIKYFIYLLEAHRPAMVLMQQAGENVSNLILYNIAKRMGVPVLMPCQVYLRNKIIISDNLTNSEIPDRYRCIPPRTTNTYDPAFIMAQDRAESVSVLLSGTRKKRGIITIPKKYHSDQYKDMGKTCTNMLIHRVTYAIEMRKRTAFLNAHADHSIPEGRFLYYPLATEPEARILVTSPYHSNQIALIENIARSIPHDSVLCVKEHPLQQAKMWRPIQWYKEVLEMPNVRLIHPSVKNSQIIPKSDAVITISGGTGFEAIFYKKPVILFGPEYYDVLPMVTNVGGMESLPKTINNAITNYEFDGTALSAFMEAFDLEALDIPYHNMINDGSIVSAIQAHGRNPEKTAHHFMLFYGKYISSFQTMAKRINSALLAVPGRAKPIMISETED